MHDSSICFDESNHPDRRQVELAGVGCEGLFFLGVFIQLEGVPREQGFVTIHDWVPSTGGRLELPSTDFRLAQIVSQTPARWLLGLPYSLFFDAVLLVDLPQPGDREPAAREIPMEKFTSCG